MWYRMRQARSTRFWLLLAFAAMCASWALLTPLGMTPDEGAHVTWAAAVVRGHSAGGTDGTQVLVPASVADAPFQDCTRRRPQQTPACQPQLSALSTEVEASTTAAGYPRPYYWLVGWPSIVTFNRASWYAMRLASVAVCVGLLALGLWTLRPSRWPLAAVAVALTATPSVTSIVGSVNPSGPEICSAFTIGVAALGLYDAIIVGGRARLRAVWVLAGATAYLTIARPSTYTLAAGAITLVLLFLARRLLAAARTDKRTAARDLAILIGLPAVAYALFSATSRPVAGAPPISWTKAVWRFVLPHVPARLQESSFRVTDSQLGRFPTLLWLVVTAVLVIYAFRIADRFERLLVIGAWLAAIVVGPAFAFHSIFSEGAGYQARYALSVYTTALLLCCLVIGRHRPAWAATPSGRSVIGVWILLGLAAMSGSLARYAHGDPAPSTIVGVLLHHSWLPPAWPLLLACLLVLALAVRALVRPTPVRPSEVLTPAELEPTPGGF
jgi:hypothetical protein